MPSTPKPQTPKHLNPSQLNAKGSTLQHPYSIPYGSPYEDPLKKKPLFSLNAKDGPGARIRASASSAAVVGPGPSRKRAGLIVSLVLRKGP